MSLRGCVSCLWREEKGRRESKKPKSCENKERGLKMDKAGEGPGTGFQGAVKEPTINSRAAAVGSREGRR